MSFLLITVDIAVSRIRWCGGFISASIVELRIEMRFHLTKRNKIIIILLIGIGYGSREGERETRGIDVSETNKKNMKH